MAATNIETRIEGDKLVIEVDLTQEYGPTTSGKNIKVASTNGNMAIPDREDLRLGLNVYKPTESSR